MTQSLKDLIDEILGQIKNLKTQIIEEQNLEYAREYLQEIKLEIEELARPEQFYSMTNDSPITNIRDFQEYKRKKDLIAKEIKGLNWEKSTEGSK